MSYPVSSLGRSLQPVVPRTPSLEGLHATDVTVALSAWAAPGERGRVVLAVWACTASHPVVREEM